MSFGMPNATVLSADTIERSTTLYLHHGVQVLEVSIKYNNTL